jgi:RimJ/RimL family protein N-acetyltransferase
MLAELKRRVWRHIFIDEPDWNKSGCLEKWHEQYADTQNQKVEIGRHSAFEVQKLNHNEVKEFSDLMRKNISGYEFLSGFHKWLAFIRRSPKYYERVLLSGRHVLLRVKNKSGEIVGGLEAKIKINIFNERFAHIRWILLLPEYRGNDIGINLFNTLEQLLISQRVFYTLSAVHKDNQPSKRAHEKCGAKRFAIIGDSWFFVKRLSGRD